MASFAYRSAKSGKLLSTVTETRVTPAGKSKRAQSGAAVAQGDGCGWGSNRFNRAFEILERLVRTPAAPSGVSQLSTANRVCRFPTIHRPAAVLDGRGRIRATGSHPGGTPSVARLMRLGQTRPVTPSAAGRLAVPRPNSSSTSAETANLAHARRADAAGLPGAGSLPATRFRMFTEVGRRVPPTTAPASARHSLPFCRMTRLRQPGGPVPA